MELMAYGTYGHLDAGRSNAVLLSSHYMVHFPRNEWLIGPRKAFDPEKLCPVATTWRGSMVLLSPADIDPLLSESSQDLFCRGATPRFVHENCEPVPSGGWENEASMLRPFIERLWVNTLHAEIENVRSIRNARDFKTVIGFKGLNDSV